MICSCGRTLMACVVGTTASNIAHNIVHDRLVLQRFVDGAERHSPLKRARLASEVIEILAERGLVSRYANVGNDELVIAARKVVPACERTRL